MTGKMTKYTLREGQENLRFLLPQFRHLQLVVHCLGVLFMFFQNPIPCPGKLFWNIKIFKITF